ncbi:unnamed protein product, partial [Owenia fusiformis]
MSSTRHFKSGPTCSLCRSLLIYPKGLRCKHACCPKCLRDQRGYFNFPECGFECIAVQRGLLSDKNAASDESTSVKRGDTETASNGAPSEFTSVKKGDMDTTPNVAPATPRSVPKNVIEGPASATVNVIGIPDVNKLLNKIKADAYTRRAFEDDRRKKEQKRRVREDEKRFEEDQPKPKSKQDERSQAISCFGKAKEVIIPDQIEYAIVERRKAEDKLRKEEDGRRIKEDKKRQEEDKMWSELDNLLKNITTMGLTYDEIIKKICLYVDEHYKNLCKQENELAMKLQNLRMVNKHHAGHKESSHDPKKEWKDGNRKHVELLRQIGNIHREMGNLKNPIEFVKSIAIYECALVHCQDIDDEMDARSDIYNDSMRDEALKLQREKRQTLDDFFQQCTEKDTPMPDKYFEDDRANKEKLQDIRSKLQQKILSVDDKPHLYNCYEQGLDKEERVIREAARIRKNGEIFEWIQNEMKYFMATLITQCQDLLNFHKTDFAFIAFGSLSRKETTPYSDVEFGAVQNSDNPDMDPMYRKCLEHLLMTLHLKLLSFGETVLPAMDITSLNESDLNDPTKDWYLDF